MYMPTRKRFTKDSCAPKTKKSRLPYSCYTRESLIKLKEMWNARHSDAKIKTKNPRAIWRMLKVNLKNVCNKESCWLRQNFAKRGLDKDLLEYTFAPKRPKEWKKKPLTWLTSVDILKVMKQWEKIDDTFVFIGPSPIDFDKHLLYNECVWDELCKFSLRSYIKNGTKKVGIIFNLDPHDKGGSHWVCSYIDLRKKEIYYFDSYGDKTPKEVVTFAKRIIKQATVLGLKYKFVENVVRHQYSSSECGIYSMYIIIKLIQGRKFQNLTTKKIADASMTKLRKVYFNPI